MVAREGGMALADWEAAGGEAAVRGKVAGGRGKTVVVEVVRELEAGAKEAELEAMGASTGVCLEAELVATVEMVAKGVLVEETVPEERVPAVEAALVAVGLVAEALVEVAAVDLAPVMARVAVVGILVAGLEPEEAIGEAWEAMMVEGVEGWVAVVAKVLETVVA